MSVQLINGDCLDVLDMLPSNSVDSIVTDPPYGLKFMGKAWDHSVPSVEIWEQCLRVLKPGGHLLSFFGTRTYHRGVVNIEDAGFEIRDQIAWVYGSGFPKSHDVSKGIDAKLGATRQIIAEGKPVKRMIPGADQNKTGSWIEDNGREYVPTETAAGSPEAAQWEGWGTALKPAVEPIVVARKPLIGTVAENVMEWGVGGLNIDGCRVEGEPWVRPGSNAVGGVYGDYKNDKARSNDQGRWPANLIHDGSDEVLACFPDSKGQQGDVRGTEASRTGGEGTNCYGEYGRVPAAKRGDSGSAARFFYAAKASKSDRNDGLDDFQPLPSAASEFRPNHTEKAAEGHDGNPYGRWKPLKNNHPTVKPTDLMRYLCRLITPPGGTVLDPFMGSGSTGRGAVLEGFAFIGVELDPHYHTISRARINAALLEALA